MVVPVVWALSQLRNLKCVSLPPMPIAIRCFAIISLTFCARYLSPTSFLGIVGVLVSLGVVSYYGISNPHPPENFPFIFIKTAPFYFGIAVFALEGILLALPLEANMQNRKDYGFVLDLCMVFVALLYIGFAMTGYLTFGDGTQSVIAKNLPANALVLVVQICLIVELLCSYPLQLAPVISMAEAAFLNPRNPRYEVSTHMPLPLPLMFCIPQ